MILYKTVGKAAQVEQIIEKSRFITHVRPVAGREEADSFFAEIKKEYKDATHNVPAMVIGDKFQIQWASDDGEPQGTSGAPVVQMLVNEGITNVAVVVTRYFGGILLGGGGLVRAYSHCASLAVNEADILNMYFCNTAIITMDYDLYGKISYILPEFETKLISSDFGNNVKITVNVKSELYDSFCKKLTDITSGKILIEKTNELFDNF